MPPQHQEDSALWETDAGQDAEAPIELLSMNHAALGVQDVEFMTKYAAASAL